MELAPTPSVLEFEHSDFSDDEDDATSSSVVSDATIVVNRHTHITGPGYDAVEKTGRENGPRSAQTGSGGEGGKGGARGRRACAQRTSECVGGDTIAADGSRVCGVVLGRTARWAWRWTAQIILRGRLNSARKGRAKALGSIVAFD